MSKQEQQDSPDRRSATAGRKVPTAPSTGIARPNDAPEDQGSGHHEEPSTPRGRARIDR